ncbi:codanin-1 [Leptidea sinapis]|uniref:codanin-1 n=1 Tax=Leptidea sinapis TaxID=189913 RepID=UPI0021418070|nr:codanin-1 [Leptidea sinapis]
MSETILNNVLSGKLSCDLMIKWLNYDSIEGAPDDCVLYCCDRNEFVSYFLSYLRSQTDNILATNSNASQLSQSTPDKLNQRKHTRSISDPTYENDRSNDILTVKSAHRTQESPNKDKKKPGRRVKTKLFTDENKDNSVSSDDSRISTGVERLIISSTPLKNGYRDANFATSPLTPTHISSHDRCDTPRLNRHSKSQEKSFSLGDFIVNQPKSVKKKRTKNTSNEGEEKVDLDLSNSEIFPEIGARKASSLKSDRRRINPTNINKIVGQKSQSLNNFTTDLQQPSLGLEENLAFTPKVSKEPSNNYEAERNILRHERHRLMEKFNILNTNTSQKLCASPQITNLLQRHSFELPIYIDAEPNKVVFKEKLDSLIEIYDILLKNNLILSINTEIYFLITILLSKQTQEDYSKNDCQSESNLLKTIHNCTYFAVKSFWYLRTILDVILDKNSLKSLGENKKVRNFFPDLAKFLLNSYGLKREADRKNDKKSSQDSRFSNGIVCFNMETDNADNFPSLLSFQNFKKQRDMFYEILRWYQDSASIKSSFRSRIKALLSTGPCAANHAHLAALFVHLLIDSLPPDRQETKLSKLQRRLTCRPEPESHRLPNFTNKELFFKEFIMFAESESFRVHLRDTLATEIIALNNTHIGNETSNSAEMSGEFLHLSKKLALLAKFLGYLTSLPYVQVPMDTVMKSGAMSKLNSMEGIYSEPKEKVLENNIAMRNYSRPSIDLIGILTTAKENGRLCITIPWIVHYLSMLDYTTLRLNYYQKLLKMLQQIYTDKLKLTDEYFKKNTIVYLKTTLGWFFDLPHSPREMICEKSIIEHRVDGEFIDCCELIDESILIELCPFLKDINVMLASKVSKEKLAGSFRHITPVSLSLNSEDRIRNKERELQARLEEELLKSQPSSTRRVLELVIDRVTSRAIKELTSKALVEARIRAREQATVLVSSAKDKSTLVQSLETIYAEQLEALRSQSLEESRVLISGRVSAALTALLPSASAPAPAPLNAIANIAAKACNAKLAKWMNEHWNTTAVLHKNLKMELSTLLTLEETSTPPTAQPVTQEQTCFESPAFAIITLKEHVCQLLDGDDPENTQSTLEVCVRVCSASSAVCRPPTLKVILQLSVDYIVVFVSRKPTEVTDELLNNLHNIWNLCCPDRKPQFLDVSVPERRHSLSPTFRDFDERAPTPISDDEGGPPAKIVYATDIAPVLCTCEVTGNEAVSEVTGAGKSEVGSNGSDKNSLMENKDSPRDFDSESNLQYFDRILCPRNIVLLSKSPCKASDVWQSLANVIVFMLNNWYLSEDSLTEQCLAVYRQDWPQNILENLSTCMKAVSSKWSRNSTGKFTLFLDFLADYCENMDFEPLEE